MNSKRAREPEEKLIGADEAFPGAAEVREMAQQRKVVVLRVPLWVLLDAIDALEPHDLHQVARHVAHRLTSVKSH